MSQADFFSAASGVTEAPDLFEKRLPAKMQAACPRRVTRNGTEKRAAVAGGSKV